MENRVARLEGLLEANSKRPSRERLTLQTAINRFVAQTNDKPEPFVRTKSADAILAAV